MDTDVVPEPGTLDRIDTGTDPRNPDPIDCLPPGEEPTAVVSLSPGWVALTDRELLLFHPDRAPALARVPRVNVTAIAVRRAGGRTFLSYAPNTVVFALIAGLVGAALLSVSPGGLVAIPEAPGAGQLETIVGALARATRLLGVVLVFGAVLAAVSAATAVGYWLVSKEVALVVERGDADPIECPTTKTSGTRALRALEPEISGRPPDARRSKRA